MKVNKSLAHRTLIDSFKSCYSYLVENVIVGNNVFYIFVDSL